MDPALQDGRRVSDLGRSKGVQELSSLTGKPASDLPRQNDKPSPTTVPNELWIASLLRDSGALQGSSAHGGAAWAGCPVRQSGINGQLCPSEERQAVNHNLESARIKVVDGVEVQVSDEDIRAHPTTRLSANARRGVLERKTLLPKTPETAQADR